MSNWSRSQRKRYKDEVSTDTKPYIRDCFLSEKMKAKRKEKVRKVAARLLGESRSNGIDPAADGENSTGTWSWKFHNSATGESV